MAGLTVAVSDMDGIHQEFSDVPVTSPDYDQLPPNVQDRNRYNVPCTLNQAVLLAVSCSCGIGTAGIGGLLCVLDTKVLCTMHTGVCTVDNLFILLKDLCVLYINNLTTLLTFCMDLHRYAA